MRALMRSGGRLHREGVPLVAEALKMAGRPKNGHKHLIVVGPTPTSYPSNEISLIVKAFSDEAYVLPLTDDPNTLPDYDQAATEIPAADVYLQPGGNCTQLMADLTDPATGELNEHGRLIRDMLVNNTAVLVSSSTGTMFVYELALTNDPIIRHPLPKPNTDIRFINGLGALPGRSITHLGEPADNTTVTWNQCAEMQMRSAPPGTVTIGQSTHATLKIDGDEVSLFPGEDYYAYVQKYVTTPKGVDITTLYVMKHANTRFTFSEFFAA